MGNDEILKIYQQGMTDTGLQTPVMDLITNLACKDKAQRDEAYENMRRGIDICDALDAEVVHVAGCGLVDGVTPEDGKKWVAEGLMDFVDDINKRGMTLAFENFDPSPDLICAADDCLDIINQTDGKVQFVFDNGNFEASGEHAEDNFDKMFDLSCHFHFKDFEYDDSPEGYHGTYFGKGKVKNLEIAQRLKQTDYDRWIALESYPQSGNGPRETVPQELTFLKSMFE